MQKWEYQLVVISEYEALLDKLNELGAEGWEAVGLIEASSQLDEETVVLNTVVLLKRPIE